MTVAMNGPLAFVLTVVAQLAFLPFVAWLGRHD